MIVCLVIALVAIDQALKLYVHSAFSLGESVKILPFFELCYVENNGMAFGIEWFDKLFLTVFRIIAVGCIAYYIHVLLKRSGQGQPVRTSFLAMLSLVLAGALGNIIDCIFYGKLFGYAGWFYGRVIDMLYFPIITNSAGECLFFRPVFNFADSCITIAVFALIIWFRQDLDTSLTPSKTKTDNEKK